MSKKINIHTCIANCSTCLKAKEPPLYRVCISESSTIGNLKKSVGMRGGCRLGLKPASVESWQ